MPDQRMPGSATTESRSASRGLVAVVVAVLLSAGAWGCGPSKNLRQSNKAVSHYFAGDYQTAKTLLLPIVEEPDNDFVLNNARLGSVALAEGDYREAEAAFLRAYEVMNSVGVNNGGRSLGAVLVDEQIRIWKGEPFERAMVSFYLGVLYYMQGDYANARGALENALFKLRDYTDPNDEQKAEEVDSNFALGYILLGKCWLRLGDTAQAASAFSRAVSLRPELQYLADADWNTRSNVLLVVDFGFGPRKISGSAGTVGFRPEPSNAGPLPTPQLALNARATDIGGVGVAPVDLLVLAQDRRWQSIDTIRAIKSVTGTAMVVGGAIATTSRDSNTQLAGLAVMGVGMLMKASATADTRGWDMLPRTTYLLPLRLSPGHYDMTVMFPSAGGVGQTINGVEVPATGEVTRYFRIIGPYPAGM